MTVPAEGNLVVSVESGTVWYGWHGTRHGSEGRTVIVPECELGDEALIVTNHDTFDRPVKIFVEPDSFSAPIRGTDDSISVVPTCDPNAIPIP